MDQEKTCGNLQSARTILKEVRSIQNIATYTLEGVNIKSIMIQDHSKLLTKHFQE